MSHLQRITLDPKVMVGKPVIKGTRLTVEFILGLLVQGWSEADIFENYPGICAMDLEACCQYDNRQIYRFS